MTAAERSLLLALFRWARAEGIQCDGLNYWNSRPGSIAERWGIDFNRGDRFLTIWRARTMSHSYWVASIAEAVDVLVALGIAPARFSTAYSAGWNAYIEMTHPDGAEPAGLRPVGRERLGPR